MIYEILLNDTKYLVEVDDTEARLKKLLSTKTNRREL